MPAFAVWIHKPSEARSVRASGLPPIKAANPGEADAEARRLAGDHAFAVRIPEEKTKTEPTQ